MDDVSEHYFSSIDYVLFSLTLIFSFLVGIYFGLWGNKAHTTNEYLLAGRSMQIVPIALSLIANQVSGNTIIAVPAEIYKFGAYYLWSLVSDLCAAALMYYICIPVYMKLQLTSIYEYMKMRFDTNVLRLVSVLFIIASLTYTPTVLYLPALTFSKVTGFGIYGVTIIVSLVCVIYTTIGGFKAVIWTDALQFAIIIASMLAVLIIGFISAGGVAEAWEKAVDGQRLDIFDFRLDPTLRDSFWSTFVGNFFFLLSVTSVNQSSMQKYLALPNFTKVKRCMIIHFTGLFFVKLATALTGIVAYANYAKCDPFLLNKITQMDQLMPYFVMDITRNLPGLPGLYIVGIFSAALSTLSSSLNTTATCIYQDILLPFLPAEFAQESRTRILKVIVVILGVISVLLVVVVEQVGGVFFFSTAFQGISGGPILGLFLLGILFPFVNAKAALISGSIGLIFASWFIVGNMWYKSQGLLQYKEKPASIENCTISSNSTIKPIIEVDNSDIFVLYRISFWYYTMISTLVVVVTGVIISWFTKEDEYTVNPDLLSPVVHRFLPKVKTSDGCVYYDLHKANIAVNSEGPDKTNVQ